jgi:dihydroxy-acid dehydratase
MFITFYLFSNSGSYIHVLNLSFSLIFMQCYGEYVSGSINDEQRKNVLRNSCPGAGACGGMYTANTMASAIETMGMSLPYRCN